MDMQKIIEKLPYEKPFLFVDTIISLDENGATGKYTFKKDEYFYQGHFKNNPVTPGVILTECMAQIGLVCLGIYLVDVSHADSENMQIAFTESHIEYFKPVFPSEEVTVVSEKMYYRFGKLKCKVEMKNANNDLVCKGVLSGMILNNKTASIT